MKEVKHKEDRKLLVTLANSLVISVKNISRDELQYWNITGTKGKIETDGTYWYIYAEGNNLEKRLSFMEPQMNGLSFKLDRMPTEEEAEIIRKIVGLKKKKQYSAEYLEVLKIRGKSLSKKGGF